MTQEEKAKRYDEAIEIAKDYVEKQNPPVSALYEIFPELKESEDEQIRKGLIKALGSIGKRNWGGIDVFESIAWLEKQGEQKPVDKEYTFKSIPRLLDMIEPSEKAKFYCQKLIDTLTKEGYNTDVKIVGECLKRMNDEKVGMATMDEQDEQSKEITYTHEVETGNGNIKALVMEKVQLPKFKVGDKVRMKEFESFPHICTVEDVDSDVYYCDFTNFDIDDQDGWELVKEPKFKVGDFIVNDYCMGRVVEITNDAYLLDTGQGIPFSCEHNAHLWSISDAKDGDVLYSPCCKLLWIYKDEKTCYVGSNLNYNSGSIVINKSVCIPTDVIPATKEQRELLFQKMKEAGYEWNPATKLGHKEVTKKSDKDSKYD